MDREDEITPISKYDEFVNSPFFMSANILAPTHIYMCGYCMETKGNMLVTNCTHCGAPLKDGYRFVGMLMDGPFLYVKESDMADKKRQLYKYQIGFPIQVQV